ncbi:hypothetical protein [Acetobacter musti]|nr:hypothetical protein [Acetobacter musti]
MAIFDKEVFDEAFSKSFRRRGLFEKRRRLKTFYNLPEVLQAGI